jgi:YfiR/HmsC-like
MRERGIGAARLVGVILLSALVARPASPSAADAAQSPEYLIKAAYLYNFAMFVEWPSDAFARTDSPIVIGVVGSDPFGKALDSTVQNKRINKRPLIVERLHWNQDLKRCHILFVSASETARIAELAERLNGRSVLIVGDTPDLASRGATINFAIEDNRVRFEINVRSARRARLNVSSKLLNLARVVRSS